MFLNITTEAFMEKPQSYSNLKFIQVEKTIDGMANLIKDGHGFTSLYNVKNVVTKTKNKSNWKETWFIGYDIDHHKESMNEVYDKLIIKPSIAYTTPSNKDNDYCFRLIYVLNKPINNIDEFNNTYLSFSNFLGINEIIDNHAKDCTRLFNGSYQCKQIVNKEQVIDLSKYNLKEYTENERPYNNTKIEREKAVLYGYSFSERNDNKKVNKEFLNDFYSMDYVDFYEKYYLKGNHINQVHTFIEDDGTKKYIYYPKDYIEICRKWDYVMIDGFPRKVKHRFKDGEGRRHILWENLMTRRKINPNLTLEDLLYCLAYEIYLYHDNSDGQLKKYIVFGIALRAINYDLNSYNPNYTNKHKYKLSSAYCQIHKITTKEQKLKLMNEIQSELKSMSPIISMYYEFGLTPKEVFNLMVSDGIEIKSVRTVQKWFKDNGIREKKDEKVFELIDINKTFPENAYYIRKVNGLSIANDKLQLMINEKKNMKNTVFESDEEMLRFQEEMMAKKMEREEGDNTSKEADTSVPEAPESVCAIDPTTIKDEEKEELAEQNRGYDIDVMKVDVFNFFLDNVKMEINDLIHLFQEKYGHGIESDKELGKKVIDVALENIGFKNYELYQEICFTIETVFDLPKPKSMYFKSKYNNVENKVDCYVVKEELPF